MSEIALLGLLNHVSSVLNSFRSLETISSYKLSMTLDNDVNLTLFKIIKNISSKIVETKKK